MLNLEEQDVPNIGAVVSDFINPDKAWNFSLLHSFLPNNICNLGKSISIPSHDIEDSFCWGLSASGSFTTKSVTWKAHNIPLDIQQPLEFAWIWNLDIMPKLKIFLWQICHNALATCANLVKSGLNLDPICPLCHSELESTSHLFTQCFVTRKTWELAYQHKWILLNISHVRIMSNIDLLTFTRGQASSDQVHCIISLIWSIWKSCNAVVFKNEIYNSVRTIIRAKRNWAEWKVRKRPDCLLYTSPSPRDGLLSRMPSSA